MNKPLAVIIEDDIEISKIFTLTLQGEFEIESFQDGLTALSRLENIVPNIVILDLNLPTMSGSEILKQIRADARLESTAVILATADAVTAATLQDAADIVLIKPVSPVQLRALASRLQSTNN
jgi:two-component system phosphate regulon response regulator PhoB